MLSATAIPVSKLSVRGIRTQRLTGSLVALGVSWATWLVSLTVNPFSNHSLKG